MGHLCAWLNLFDILSMAVCTTRHWQTSGRLVQELNVCTVDAHIMVWNLGPITICSIHMVPHKGKYLDINEITYWMILNWELLFPFGSTIVFKLFFKYFSSWCVKDKSAGPHWHSRCKWVNEIWSPLKCGVLISIFSVTPRMFGGICDYCGLSARSFFPLLWDARFTDLGVPLTALWLTEGVDSSISENSNENFN